MSRKLPSLTLALLASLAVAAPSAPAATGLANHRALPEGKSPSPQDERDHGLIAPQAACPNQTSGDAPLAVQREAMLCMTEYARRYAGMAGLDKARKLDRSASAKSRDILRCDSFSHFACGREFTYWMRRSGYLAARCWRTGENLAWGTGRAGTPRAIFLAWMHSPGHRRNILGRFSQIGIGLRIGNLDGRDATHVWTQHFGSHC